VKTPSLRFSLRFLLLASALIPLAGYWLALPTLHAQQQLCVDRRKPFPGSWKEHQTFHPRPSIQELTLSDLWSGKRELFVSIAYGDGSGLASCGVECTATRRGSEVGMAIP